MHDSSVWDVFLAPNEKLCQSNQTCIIKDLDGTVAYSKYCRVTQDNKFEYPNRNYSQAEEEIFECMISSWDEHDTFDSDQLPFFIEMFPLIHKSGRYVGLDLRLQYIEFMEARFRFKNLHYCGKPWEEIIGIVLAANI